MCDIKITKEKTIELINLYREFDCLWNTNSNVYKRSDLKKKAWEELADTFNMTVDNMKKKIKYLRTAYMAENKKVENSKKSGSSGDVYKPNLFYFEELHFLHGTTVVRKCSENMPSETFDNIDEAAEATEQYMQSENAEVEEVQCLHKRSRDDNGKPRSRRTSERESTYDKAVAAIVASVKAQDEEMDVYTSFAKSIALQLKQLPPLDSSKLMGEVQLLISERTQEVLLRNLRAETNSSEKSSSFGSSSTPIKIPGHIRKVNLLHSSISTTSLQSSNSDILTEALENTEINFI